MNVEIANRLLQLRKENGLSQEDLAARLGVTRQAVSKWERAEAAPDTDNLLRLARLYSVSLDQLLLNGLDEADLEEDEEAATFIVEPENMDGVSQGAPAPFFDENMDGEAEAAEAIPFARPIPQPNPPRTFNPNEPVEFNIGDMKFRFRWHQFPYPIVVAIAFVLLGLLFNWWHPGWLIFLTIPLYYTMPAFHKTDRISALKSFPYPVLVVILYLCIGIFFHWWHPGWLIFLTIPLYYIFLNHAV